jgi:hypothetical protein
MSNLSDPMLIYVVGRQVVTDTLTFFRQKGLEGDEAVALWPGRIVGDRCLISAPLVPAQEAGPLFYRIPDEEVFRILEHVSERGLVIPMQVHSHPRRAFHSWADDERAFVQHENGISIVVPNFGQFPDPQFTRRARFYRLKDLEWQEMRRGELDSVFRFEGL